eukprot:NODE_1045_length_1144_cov_278.236530_g797_i0.p1 GENE.NODE_1045_length_1144_cov_278.236530_g797_i0~~NODE_1045_length_1144_cov_278.236530_g797_i0.p1  ORF type:complete len:356 (+),score=74.84 NODE_1045_length_1144_cov_278.236530_g797_i0:59-1069(+)
MSLPTHRSSILVNKYVRDKPWEAISVEKLDVPQLEIGEVLVAMEFAPINPSDANVMEGVYYTLPGSLPSIVGMEGCGRVIAKEESVTDLQIGDPVISPAGWKWGTYTQFLTMPACDLKVVPQGIPMQVASTLTVNPCTAYALLRTVPLDSGDWVIQNVANSGVGQAVIQVAQRLGLNVINVIRRPEAAEAVIAAGGENIAVFGEEGFVAKVKALAKGSPIRLALDAVGGDNAKGLASALAPSGTMVTYGVMSRQPIPVSGGQLVFKDLRFVGFHLKRWLQAAAPDAQATMWEVLFGLAAAGKLAVPIEKIYKLEEAEAAIEHAFEGGRKGKVLFAM